MQIKRPGFGKGNLRYPKKKFTKINLLFLFLLFGAMFIQMTIKYF
jgi:hypothetical protein